MKKTNINYEKNFGSAPMWPLIWTMALPAIMAQFVNLLYSIVDRIYIGHIPVIGKDALAGIGVSSTIIIILAAFAVIVATGGSSLAAIALGKKDHETAEKYLGNGFFLLIIFSIILPTIIYKFMENLLRLTGASNVTIVYAKDYLSVYLLGTFFVMISTGLNSFINCQGQPRIAMLSVLIGAISNIILDPILIFVFNFGVKGAAIASVISQFISAVWILKFLFSKKASLTLSKKYIIPDDHIIKSMFSLGISPFVMASTESLIGFILNGSLAKYGDIYVSALTIMQSAMQFISVPITGFAQGSNPIISYNYGHGNVERIKKGFKINLYVIFTYNFVIVILMLLFPGHVARIFTNDKELILIVEKVLPIFLTGMSIFGLQRTCQNMFVSTNDAKISLFIALLRKVFLLTPLALILPHLFNLGVNGIYLAESISDATAAIICTAIFIKRFPIILKRSKNMNNIS